MVQSGGARWAQRGLMQRYLFLWDEIGARHGYPAKYKKSDATSKASV